MRIAIIGAGLAGLVSAYSIHKQQPEAKVEVFEATDRIGGKLFTVPFDSGPTDMGAEAYLAFRKDATEFFEELNLGGEIVDPSGLPSLLYVDGELHAMPMATVMGIPGSSEGLEGLVSEESRARIDAEGEAEPIPWALDKEVSVGALVRERYGDDVVEHVVSALQGGVYSSTSDDLGLRATMPQIANTFDAMLAEGQPVTLSGAVKRIMAARPVARGYKPKVFGAFRGGYAQAYEALAEQSGADIHIDAFISQISRTKEGFKLKGADGVFDRVLLAVPAPTAAVLLKGLGEDAQVAAEQLKRIPLASSVVVGMKFDDEEGLPDNSGILVATDAKDVRAKAFTFSSKKWPHLGERGGALVRASFGRYGDDAITRMEEDELVDLALDDLQRITGFDGRAAGLSEIFVQRWFGGLPVYNVEHLDAVAAARDALAKVPGIEATGAWDQGVGVPDVIVAAKDAAERVLGS
ncbi:protoporphyrinogen oxidase [Corynebacterium gerontici]|uniref:Coproporphyrinogen III oxidase n=1 Tax=Corynebacterium gerontici TaxID=2079234 RepID=A0A3G6J701_9CORY|nr:protoporphyrinogen oxidase [Corynebacterium gerontici]AZA12220.1 Protoporphyrinogen oxidase [Corynebacterium gerontici]